MSLIYYIIFILIFIGSIKEYSDLEKGSKQYYYFIVTLMILTASLGYALSPDWLAYLRAFNGIRLVNWNELSKYSEVQSMEIGYIFLNKIIYSLGFDYGMIAVIMVTISVLLKSTTIFKFTNLPFLALFMYAMPTFMFEEHIHIRQGLATAISFYSIKYILEKKLFKFILCMVLAYQFHESCIVFVLAYWLVRIKVDIVILGWIVTIAIIGNYIGLNSIIEFIMQYMPFGQDKFEDYQSQLYAESGISVGDIVKILTVLFIIIYNKYAEHDELYCKFRNLLIFGICLYFFLGKGIFGIRLPGYYLIFLGLTSSRLVYNFKGEKIKQDFIFYSFILYTSILIFWFQYKQGHKTNFGNYKTFFTEGAAYGLWKN